jgi:hypothetical protein
MFFFFVSTYSGLNIVLFYTEPGKGGEFAMLNEKKENTAENEKVQSTVSAVPTETKGEVTLDSKTGNIITGVTFFPFIS